MHRILVVDSDPLTTNYLNDLLNSQGFQVDHASCIEQAQCVVSECLYSLVIIDADLSTGAEKRQSSGDGYELHQRLSILQPGLPVLLISAHNDLAKAINAIKMGAVDFLSKPLNEAALLKSIGSAVSHSEHQSTIIAASPSSLQTVQLARKVAASPATVLITGESGTGKEVLSRFIHDNSSRAKGPFVAVNCAALPESMLESILFGHEKGAFTGATSRREGKFEQANGGTLFLDEVAEMPLAQQAKLLRVLQEREVDRLGGNAPIKLNVRVVAATNQDLRQQVVNGTFREDLYYRLNVFPIHWAPLRERREDILPLANALLKRSALQEKLQPPVLSPEAELCLQNHQWPGNVRELDNVLQRAVVMSSHLVIRPDDLMLESVSAPLAPKEVLEVLQTEAIPVKNAQTEISREIEQLPQPGRKKAELQHIVRCLHEHQGHRGKTAEALGISTRMLRYKLARLREMGINTEHLSSNEKASGRFSAYRFDADNRHLIYA
ncbi:sigma-54-dependent transcriptional regulator [Endozoicomonas ascidiicola]|uniref:sigma-54-dependent transcriptional regulator n=1 Tax=Endozoicomonas ascidiicola TaxID=1698521 RepID=UPI00082F37A0|nr:sigma-54 dependent transcriptional regulator [Endozoicomonas ascidiicola]